MNRPWTQVPNELADEWMRDMTGSQLKVYIIILRHTIGWHKDTDRVSVSQIQKKTGLSNRVVIEAVKALEAAGRIGVYRQKGLTTRYDLLLDEPTHDEKSQVPMTKSHRTHDEKSHTKERERKVKKKNKNSETPRHGDSQPSQRTLHTDRVGNAQLIGGDRLEKVIAKMKVHAEAT